MRGRLSPQRVRGGPTAKTAERPCHGERQAGLTWEVAFVGKTGFSTHKVQVGLVSESAGRPCRGEWVEAVPQRWRRGPTTESAGQA